MERIKAIRMRGTGRAGRTKRVQMVAARLNPPDEGQRSDYHGHGEDHAQQREEAQAVLAAANGVGEHQDRGDHVVQAPQDGYEQRADDGGAREHLQERTAAVAGLM